MINSLPPAGLDHAQSALQKSMRELGSGLRINTAKDDAAGLAVAVSLTAQLQGGNQALRNVQDALSLTDTAGGALGQASDTLQRMRELTVQAANGSNNASDRQTIQGEINQLRQSLDQLSGNAQFNGQKLLDGSFSAQIQSGGNAGETQTLALGNASPQGLGIASLDVTSPGAAASALDTLDQAISQVGALQSRVGAAQAGLNSTLASLSGSYQNLAAARSRITDTDYAQASSSQAQGLVQQQSSLKALAVYNSMQGDLLKLIQG